MRVVFLLALAPVLLVPATTNQKCAINYCNSHQDLVAAFCTGGACSTTTEAMECHAHWIQYGMDEFPSTRTFDYDVCVNAPAAPFDEQCALDYCNAHADLRAVWYLCNGGVCSTTAQAEACYTHWDDWGRSSVGYMDAPGKFDDCANASPPVPATTPGPSVVGTPAPVPATTPAPVPASACETQLNSASCAAYTDANCVFRKLKRGDCYSTYCHPADDPAKKVEKCLPFDCTSGKAASKKKKCEKVQGCAWINGACANGAPAPSSCEDYTSKGKKKCKKQTGCIWDGSDCVSGTASPPSCADYTSRIKKCNRETGCYFNGSDCVEGIAPPPSCADFTAAGRGKCSKQLDCCWIANTCYQGACGSFTPPCSVWNAGGRSKCMQKSCYWVNDACTATAATGGVDSCNGMRKNPCKESETCTWDRDNEMCMS